MYKILIVEDTLSIREEVSDILFMEGYNVFQAQNGKVGFEMALKENPDLIVSDILMPELDGFEMFKKLQKEKKTMTIPLIFLSAKGEKTDIRFGMNLGAEDYLTKPINVNDLMNAVKNKIFKKTIIDQKIIDQTTVLSKTLKQQQHKLDIYSDLISEGLKPSQINVLELLTWTQEELENNNNFEGANSEINKKWSNLGFTRYNSINTNTIAEQVIDEIDKPSHITITIDNELPTLFADEHLLEKVFKILIQNAVAHIDKKIGLIALGCETSEKEDVFSIKYDFARMNTVHQEKTVKPFEETKSTEIGLNIVKKIISHYKGKIHVKSTPNKETVFYFTIPKIINNNG